MLICLNASAPFFDILSTFFAINISPSNAAPAFSLLASLTPFLYLCQR